MTTSKNEGSGAPLAKSGTASPNRHTPESICSVNIIPYAADPFKQCRATMERKNAIRFMVIRQLDQRAFERLHSALAAQAQAEPLEASYTVNLAINSAEYAVRVQPDEGNRMAVL